MKRKTEQRFEWRIQRMLQNQGYTVLNVARSKPCDLVAMREGKCWLIEVKGRNTKYPPEQQVEQALLSRKSGFPLVLVRQLHQRGKIAVEGSHEIEDALK